MLVVDRVRKMSVNELYDAAHGKGGATEEDNGLATAAVWAGAATEELKRRGYNVPSPLAEDQAGLSDDPVSADARFIAMSASKDAGRIITHLWIIFVLLPVVLGVLFAILK
jgi:hypothetical protein